MSGLPRSLTARGLLVAAIGAVVAAGAFLRLPGDTREPAVPIAGRRAGAPAEAGQTALGTLRAADGFGPALGEVGHGRMPGEFEPTDAILLGVNELIEYHPETLVQVITALGGETDIIALVSHPDQERRTLDLLRSHGLATDRIVFFTWPVDSMWVQDFGPQQVLGDDVRIIDFEYAVPGREVANQLPMAFAATFGMKITHCHLVMEGGSLLSNGRGLCVTSTRIIDQNKNRGHDVQDIGRILKAEFGFKQWVYLPPIRGESTGHLDLFLTLGGPTTVFLASYDPTEDRDNAERMDENARVLANNVTVDGRPLEVIRIRQPAAHDGCWRSYTNVIFGNGVVIVPQFPDVCPELDREALAAYRRTFSDRRVVGIDVSKIITKRGGLHCLSLSIPRFAATAITQRRSSLAPTSVRGVCSTDARALTAGARP